MDRREFLQKGGAVVAGGLLAELGILEEAAGAAGEDSSRPNIVFILVDEMRFPSVFPAGVSTPEEFLRRFMPNVFYLWQRGVKFERYYSSGNACSPARATIATGLYPHQEWLLATRTTRGHRCRRGSRRTAGCCASSAIRRRTSVSGISRIHPRTDGRPVIWRSTASEG